jgi:hypothetical protein
MLYEIVLDHSETANKCTIVPQINRPDFQIFGTKGDGPIGPLSVSVLLHPEGICLTELGGKLQAPPKGIAAIDCIWRRLGILHSRLEAPLPVLARIPEGFVTAYPRKSEDDSDPASGLATIEAIFTAAALLGHWDETLLSAYFFGPKYVELNRNRFIELGVSEAGDSARSPVYQARPRSAEQRRRDRRPGFRKA